MKKRLFDRLIEYSGSDIYPFCMPGHKRQNRIPWGASDPLFINEKNNGNVNACGSSFMTGANCERNLTPGGNCGSSFTAGDNCGSNPANGSGREPSGPIGCESLSNNHFFDPYQLDITEVEGFDDLHRAKGILKDITDRAAEIYSSQALNSDSKSSENKNSKNKNSENPNLENGDSASLIVTPEVYMSVNGSTACNLAAVNCMPEDGTVLIAANCHRSVFNGARLARRKVIELAPQWISGLAVYGGINPTDVENALRGYPEIKSVVITSPSYEGFVSDIKRIADIVHSHGAYLIVDEAHGAHLPFCPDMPESAIYLGADIVIHSLHKTVGSLNQTALAFVNADELKEVYRERLLMFMTTSPSYILMASIEQAIEWADENRDRFKEYCIKLKELRSRIAEIGLTESSEEGLHLVDKSIVGKYNIFDLDPAKLMFYVKGMSGEALYRKFYEEHKLQFEKFGDRYALAMTTVWDTDEGFERLVQACESINSQLLDEKL